MDADVADRVTEENLDQAVAFAKEFASRYNTVAAISGALDIVADGERAYVIRNGHRSWLRLRGSGCMLTAMTAAYVTANREHPLEAAAAAFCVMGISGERAYERMRRENGGNASFRTYLIDEVYKMDGQVLMREAKYEVR